MLRETMQKGFCFVWNSSSEDKASEYSDFEVEYSSENVNILLKDPTHIPRREHNRDSSAHYVLSDNYMNQFAECFQDVLALSGHSVIFCSNY